MHSSGAVTMHYYAVIALFQILAVASPQNHSDISECLTDLYTVLNKNDTPSDEFPDIKINNSYVFETLEYKIDAILQRLSVYFRSMINAEKITLNEVDQNKDEFTFIIMTLKDYHKTVCSLVPRCIAFIHVFGTDELWPKIIQLYEVHRQLCLELSHQLFNRCIATPNENTVIIMCKIDFINKLISGFPPSRQNIEISESILSEDENLIFDIFEAINNIDKKNLVPGRHIKTFHITSINVSGQSEVTVEDYPTVVNEDCRKNIDCEIQQLNEGFAVKTDEIDLLVSDVAATLIYDKISICEESFRFIINHELCNRESKIEHSNTSNMSKPIDNIKLAEMLNSDTEDYCSFAPLVLAHLKENCSKDVRSKIDVIFGVYFTICGDWKSFLDANCPMIPDDRPIAKKLWWLCTVNMIKDRLYVNHYMFFKNNDNYDNPMYNLDIVHNLINYLLSFNKVIDEADHDREPVLPWTAVDRLIGKHVLGRRYNNVDDSVNKLQNKAIDVSIENYSTIISLSEAYRLLLPWCSDFSTVLTFHNNMVDHAHSIFNEHFYVHAQIISLYLFITNIVSIKDIEWKNLKKSIEWYTTGVVKFHKYLNRPDPNKTSIDNVIKVINALSNDEWKVKDLKVILGTRNIDMVYEYLNKTFHILDENCSSIKLINVAIDNCEEVEKFINSFLMDMHALIDIEGQSLTNRIVTTEKLNKLFPLHCRYHILMMFHHKEFAGKNVFESFSALINE